MADDDQAEAPSRSHKVAVRAGVIAITAGSVAAGWTTDVARNSKGELPNEALGSVFILRTEHAFVVFAVLLFVLVVVVKGLWDAALPSKVGRDGAEYAQTADKAEKATESLANLSNRRWSILRAVTLAQQRRLEALEKRIDEHKR